MGFPATLCFILLKYVLQNMEKQISQLVNTVKELTDAVNKLSLNNLLQKDVPLSDTQDNSKKP